MAFGYKMFSMKIKILIQLISLLSISNILISQDPQWIVYDETNSGLPELIWSAGIKSIAFDSTGNTWFGTGGLGLTKFDGVNWTTYTNNTGLNDLSYFALEVDHTGNLWAGTWGGLGKYDGENWVNYFESNSDLPSDNIMSLFVDSDNSIWIGTNKGVANFDGENWIVYNPENSGLPGLVVTSITKDIFENIWFGTYGDGVAKFDGQSWTSYSLGQVYNTISCLTIDNLGHVFAGTSAGIIFFDGIEWIYDYLYTLQEIKSSALDKSNNLWFGSPFEGVAKFDGSDWIYFNENNSGLPGSAINCIKVDKENNIWFGTQHHGVGIYHQEENSGINDFYIDVNREIIIYPNPANNNFKVKSLSAESDFLTIGIYDNSGSFITNLSKRNDVYDISDFSRGIYILKICTDNETYFSKLIKQ